MPQGLNKATPIFTVITPTYNRARTLSRPYESLLTQTYTGFEWLVVDDGSTDGTRNLIRTWQSQNGIAIRYVHCTTNCGYLAARNIGVREARQPFIVFLDSDDACAPHALERLRSHWDSISEDERDGFVGVTALCYDQHGGPIGQDLPMSPLDSSSLEMVYRYRRRQEMWGMQRADVLKQQPFSSVAGATEGITWLDIGRRYRTRYVRDRLRMYYIDEPGRSDQTHHAPIATGVEGLILTRRYLLNQTIDWFRWDPRYFLVAALQYARFSFHGGRGPVRQLSELKPGLPRVLGLVGLPLGLAVYLLDLCSGSQWLAGSESWRYNCRR